MNTIVARIRRVLTGHSPTALIHAVDENNHEQRFEVPVEQTRDAAPGRVLVIQWSVHGLPDAVPETGDIEVEPLPATSARATQIVGEINDRGAAPVNAPATAPSTDEVGQLENLLGLRPGRLRGL